MYLREKFFKNFTRIIYYFILFFELLLKLHRYLVIDYLLLSLYMSQSIKLHSLFSINFTFF
jgi:hypothetical protein